MSPNFRVTTDIDIAKGMEKAHFYRYMPSEDDTKIGILSPVRATIFAQRRARRFPPHERRDC